MPKRGSYFIFFVIANEVSGRIHYPQLEKPRHPNSAPIRKDHTHRTKPKTLRRVEQRSFKCNSSLGNMLISFRGRAAGISPVFPKEENERCSHRCYSNCIPFLIMAIGMQCMEAKRRPDQTVTGLLKSIINQKIKSFLELLLLPHKKE